ncbi:DUF2515 family protein [Caldimonas thermodepolymerans]|uniref:DUF2515 family protein n=1 Tax=Caldimonas thermodepolymerans TaxID=215580 RepID=UPI0022361BC4|nr:hypothetical protein [Caldimonas thermodepolymerans]UZG44885.1 hypothetical protein ONZ46_02735 [Caldimonas thermodepolymerans]
MAATEDLSLTDDVLGTCRTNNTPGSRHDQTVEAHHLWSYAQEEALIAVSEPAPDRCWRLITDPERRARRIAARYADLYFRSAEKSRGTMHFYWVALAAFVVKDIVGAFQYAREKVLSGGLNNALRTSSLSSLGSVLLSGGSPYEHAMRVYAALAKGNLWLFMDIYPWMWFVLEYCIRPDGTLHPALLRDHVHKRQTATLHRESRMAVEHLPFNQSWCARLQEHLGSDVVYEGARRFLDQPTISQGPAGGYGRHVARALQAHAHVRQYAVIHDRGYRMPAGCYWSDFREAFYVLEEERKELKRIAEDVQAVRRLKQVARFEASEDMVAAYEALLRQANSSHENDRVQEQRFELLAIARHEQLRILQPLIYADAMLVATMNLNHWIARTLGSAFSQPYELVFDAGFATEDHALRVRFDEPSGAWDRATGPKRSLPNPRDRMSYVREIAARFDRLMNERRTHMESVLQTIRGWINA